MIIFDLDTLADDTHRRHFIDPKKDKNAELIGVGPPPHKAHLWTDRSMPWDTQWIRKDNRVVWKPNYEAYIAAYGDDVPIEPSIVTMRRHSIHDQVKIWTSRCSSLREQTIEWLDKNITCFAPLIWYENNDNLKMRPIGNTEPAWKLKEMWLHEHIKWPLLEPATPENEGKILKKNGLPDFVFDSDPESIAMWKRKGVFVFDCRQR